MKQRVWAALFLSLTTVLISLISCGTNPTNPVITTPTATSTVAPALTVTATSTATSTATGTPTPYVTQYANFGGGPGIALLSFDTNGNLFAGGYNTGLVYEVSSTGVTSSTAGQSNANEAAPDASGNLYVTAVNGNAIYKNTGGSSSVWLNGFSGTNDIYSSVVNAASTTLYAVNYAQSNLYVINLGTKAYSTVTLTANLFPFGVTFDPSGNLWIAGITQVAEITAASLASGSPSDTIIAGSSTAGAADGSALTQAKFQYNYSIAADGSGNIYVADNGNSAIRKISGGQVTTLMASSSSSLTPVLVVPFSNVQGVALDAGFNLYCSDQSSGIIYRYHP